MERTGSGPRVRPVERAAIGDRNRSPARAGILEAPYGASDRNDGKPDLSGIWNGPVPDLVFDPSNALPSAIETVHQREQEYWKHRPSYQCLPSGPEADRFGGWKRILQTPAAIAILNDDLTYRMIFMDGRQLEANPAPS